MSLVAVVALLCQLAAAQQTVVTDSLIAELSSLTHLCRLPSIPYTSRQAASYSGYPRRDFTPDSARWWYDDDRGWFVRRDSLRQESVMMEADGPGVIERIWSANPVMDNLNIYIDSSDTPALSVPMDGLLRGNDFVPLPIAGESARGCNLYLPIPYQRHCRVSVSGVSSDELYYHVGYRTYPAGTRLASFTAATKTAQDERVMAAAGALADTGTWATASVTPRHEVVSLGVGQEQRIDLASGPSAVVELRIRVSSDQADVFLRGTVLRLTWDNADTPQVETPLGDFFGSSPFLSAYHTLPVAILPDSTLACRWVMPYQERASLAFANHSGVPGALDISVTTRPRAWDDSSMYFHAYWRQDTAVHTQSQPEGGWYMVSPPRDHGFIHIHGRGFYVGTVLQVWNNAMQWWGEGDERIYVDGEAFPSFMGTGTEDYFGYAYSTTTFFEHAYHAQPHSDGFRGFTTNLRWHIADPIPFTSELRFDMEVQTAYEPATLDLGRACFFYARPGAWTDHDGLDGEDLHLRSELTRGLAPAPARLQAPVRVRVVAMYDLQGRRLAVRPSGAACAVTVQRLAGGSSAARAALSVR